MQLFAGTKGLPSPVLLPNMQDILTASGVLCTAPCRRHSASVSSSSSLCVCGEEGEAQLWHNQVVALPMQGTAHSESLSRPITQPHTSSHLPSAKTFLQQVWGLDLLRLQHPHPQTYTLCITLPKQVGSHAAFYSVSSVLWESQTTWFYEQFQVWNVQPIH